ncbi:hypothetical protein BGW39_007632 [Mortierella sp. 14UC]|nr:hypothetical protein BGW39_007632 [Mortierella sp. 14UC]
MKFGITLLGLIATVASAIPAASVVPAGNSTSLERRSGCLSSTLTWTRRDSVYTFDLVLANNYYHGSFTKPAHSGSGHACDSKENFCVIYADGRYSQYLQLQYGRLYYTHSKQNDGFISVTDPSDRTKDIFEWKYWDCLKF